MLKTYYFIGSLLALDDHPWFRWEIIDQFEDPKFEWEKFIYTGSNHLILPTIYVKLRDYFLLEYLPLTVREHLTEIYHSNLNRNTGILSQVREINTVLNKNNILPLYFKGVGNLLDGLYKDMGERMIGDIDMLVHQRDFISSINRIKFIGYKNHWGEPLPIHNEIHYPRLYKPDVPADVEIHQLPVEDKYSEKMSVDKLHTNANKHSNYFVPSKLDALLINFIHSFYSNKGNQKGILSFRDAYDYYLLSNQTESNNDEDSVTYRMTLNEFLGITDNRKITLYNIMVKSNLKIHYCYYIINFIYEILDLIGHYLTIIYYSTKDVNERNRLSRNLSNRSWRLNHIKIIINKILPGLIYKE